MTALLLVHGRGEDMPPDQDRSAEEVARYVATRQDAWTAGLARGAARAGLGPAPTDAVYFPFYAHVLADRVALLEAEGTDIPPLTVTAGDVHDLAARLLVDTAQHAGLRDPARGTPTGPVEAQAEWSDALRLESVRAALAFLATRTGLATWVVERFFRDVAFYLADASTRAAVQEVVAASVADAVRDGHHDVVVVAHSLGSIVGFDACHGLPSDVTVRLLVTTGSPLGLPVVRRHLLGPEAGSDRRPVPGAVRPWDDAPPGWVNAFDERDVIAVVHPLAPLFIGGERLIRDVLTDNPDAPHAIEDYLADPDVAGPVVRALTHPTDGDTGRRQPSAAARRGTIG